MKRTLWALAVALMVLAICSQAQAGHVKVLTADNFDVLTAEGKWLIDFFAPWCPHCQQLEPVFEEAATAISKTAPNVKFGTVDCTVETALAERFNVEAYPTIKYYRGGYASDYEGGRDAPDFVRFVGQITSPAVAVLKEEKQLDQFKKAPVSFLLYSDNEEDVAAFTRIAEKYQDLLRFGKTSNAKLIPKTAENVEGNALVWFNDGAPEVLAVPAGSLDIDAIEKWILERKYPHFPAFDAASWKHFAALKKRIVVGVFKPNQGKSELFKHLAELAKSNDDFSFGTLDADRYSNFVNNYIGSSLPPTFFVIDVNDQLYWHNSTVQSKKASINSWLHEISSGTLTGSSVATNWLQQIAQTFNWLLGDVLEEPLILGAICVAFVIVVIIAVWFISRSNNEDEAPQGEAKQSTGAKSTAEPDTSRSAKAKLD